MNKDIYIFSNGELRRKDNTLYFESSEGKKYLPVEEINNIWIFGDVNVNKRFLEFAAQKEIILHFFNYYGYYAGSFYPRKHLNSGYVLLKQAESYLDKEKRLSLAKKIIDGAFSNMLVVLRYYKSRGIDLEEKINTIVDKRQSLSDSTTIEEVMAVEGNIREIYYSCFDYITNKPQFKFEKRSKRPPLNKLNALISFGNSLLYSTVLSEIYHTQLNPSIGYLHSTNNRKFTLNLDIAEIFKPSIVDRLLFTLINKNQITGDDFENEFNGILLTEKGRKIFVQEFQNKLDVTINHPKLNQTVSYRRIIRMELHKIQKHITQDEEYIPFIARW